MILLYVTKQKIIKNEVVCNTCKDVVRSTSKNDMISCKCGKVSISGGPAFLKRGFPDDLTAKQAFTEMATFEPNHVMEEKCQNQKKLQE